MDVTGRRLCISITRPAKRCGRKKDWRGTERETAGNGVTVSQQSRWTVGRHEGIVGARPTSLVYLGRSKGTRWLRP